MDAKLKYLLTKEQERYVTERPASSAAHTRANLRLPHGVGSSFQFFKPFPVTVQSAQGPWVFDADNKRYLDLNMGFGALLVGHGHPQVVEAITAQLAKGTLFVAPSLSAELVASELAQRFSHPLWRFTNSGTEAVMSAVRVARAHTRRPLLVKVEGGYHGHADATLVSCKPSLKDAGPGSHPNSVPESTGLQPGVVDSTIVIPYNDADALEYAFLKHEGEVAAFIVEPVLENVGIILPKPGYLKRVRELCTRFGVVLIFDEVKTGLTASYNGAAGMFGVTPDLTCLAKSIGGGLPLGAFGGREDVMRNIEEGCVHHGTYNANPLVLAAAAAALSACSREALAATHVLNEEFASTVRGIVERFPPGLRPVVQTVGSKGSISFASKAPESYRDWKASNLLLAELVWLWGTNRGVLTPPGLDEQWLVSLQHTKESLNTYAAQLEELAAALNS